MTDEPVIRRYVHLLSYAIIGAIIENGVKKSTVFLCDENGNNLHKNKDLPITFTELLPADRIFNTTLFDKGLQKPFHIINVLAEFEKDWFETHKKNIPTLGGEGDADNVWGNLTKSSTSANMTPTDKPPVTTVQSVASERKG